LVLPPWVYKRMAHNDAQRVDSGEEEEEEEFFNHYRNDLEGVGARARRRVHWGRTHAAVGTPKRAMLRPNGCPLDPCVQVARVPAVRAVKTKRGLAAWCRRMALGRGVDGRSGPKTDLQTHAAFGRASKFHWSTSYRLGCRVGLRETF